MLVCHNIDNAFHVLSLVLHLKCIVLNLDVLLRFCSIDVKFQKHEKKIESYWSLGFSAEQTA